MQVPGTYIPSTVKGEAGEVVIYKPELYKKAVHFADIDGDGKISKMEFARWFWRRQSRGPNANDWAAFSGDPSSSSSDRHTGCWF